MSKEDAFEDFISHWRSLPVVAGRKVPAKSLLRPQAIVAHLPHALIIERVGRYDVQLRLIGTSLDAGFDVNLTGINSFEMHARETWEFYADYFDCLLETPCGSRMSREATDMNGKTVLADALMLPMCDDDGDVRFMCGLMILRSEAVVPTTVDAAGRTSSRVIDVRYVDIGHGLPADPPELPG